MKDLKLEQYVDQAIVDNNKKNDKILLILIAIHWFIATFITSYEYSTYQLGFISGGVYFLTTLFAYYFYRGEKYFRIIAGMIFMLFSMVFIQQHLGRIEMHFHIFIAISFLTIYKDQFAIISAGLTTIIYHILFNYMQLHQMTLFGQPVYIFNYGCGWDIVILHSIFAVFEILVIAYLIQTSKKRFINGVMNRYKYKKLAEELEGTIIKRTKELNNTNRQFEEAQKIANLGNWEWNLVDDSLMWSDEIYRIFGLKKEEYKATYENFINAIHEDDRKLVQDAVQHSLESGEDYMIKHRIVLPNGTEKMVLERGAVTFDEENKPMRMLGIVLDITPRHEREKELQLQSELLNSISDSIFVHDLDGNILYANESAYNSRGYTKEELYNLKIMDLDYHDEKLGHEVYEQNMEKIKQDMQEYGIATFEVSHKTKNTHIIPLEVTSKIINIDKKMMVISIARDITERKALYKNLEVSEKKYKNLVENSQVGIFSTKVTGEILYVNQYLVDLFQYDSQEEFYQQKAIAKYKKPEERSVLLQNLMEKGYVNNMEIEVLTKYDEIRTISLSAYVENELLSGVVLDITESKKAIEEISKLSQTIKDIDDLVMISDRSGILTFVNKAFTNYAGYTYEESIGKTASIVKSGKHDKSFYKKMWSTILSGETYRSIITNRKKDGDLYYEEKTITPIKDDKGDITAFVSTGKDITQRIEMQQDLEKLATTDQLTGIYNRHKFEELLELEINRFSRYKKPFSLIMFDIDHFKKVNDTYGHDIGDYVLKNIAKIVKMSIRASDIFARWGGEEFLVLCTETNLQNTEKLAEKLRESISAYNFENVGNITASFGVTSYNEKDDRDTFLKRVDETLYGAKTAGRNRVIKK